jgi:hypothetical protein
VQIRYEHSERERSALYLEVVPLFMSGRCRLISRRLLNQFASLQRKTSGLGKDRIDHPRGAHDDASNAAAGALALAADGRHVPLHIPPAALVRARQPDHRSLFRRLAMGGR